MESNDDVIGSLFVIQIDLPINELEHKSTVYALLTHATLVFYHLFGMLGFVLVIIK